jgi:hypothetical protein
MQQNYKNHVRMVPGFHYLTTLFILAILVLGIINLVSEIREGEGWTEGLMFLLIAFTLASLFWYTRTFALTAQDRAIRAEESLRYYQLTGERLPPELRLSQIIALRFAPDEEFVPLAKQAIAEKLSAKDIKQAIKNWKADYHRV